MKPLTNAQIEEQKRKVEEKFGTKSTGTGLGCYMRSYRYGCYDVVWTPSEPALLAEVRDAASNDTIVFRGTKDECIAWAKKKAGN